jgi:hypothetical protein
MLLSSPANAQQDSREYQLKAAYLKIIPSFVQWPLAGGSISSIDGLHICVYGVYSFGIVLAQQAAISTAAGKKMDIRSVRKRAELKGCNVVFISRSEQNRYSKILELVRGSNTLTVGESSGFLDAGGMVNLDFRNDSMQFDVNLDAVRAAQLNLDARFLSLANRVIDSPDRAGI